MEVKTNFKRIDVQTVDTVRHLRRNGR
ncbi:unnamed protein product, partial [Rotaria sordida]